MVLSYFGKPSYIGKPSYFGKQYYMRPDTGMHSGRTKALIQYKDAVLPV